jgi:hypothetical protein
MTAADKTEKDREVKASNFSFFDGEVRAADHR